MDIAGQALWGIPGRFGMARVLGPSYLLRCVVFHHISATESPFTTGMNVRTTPREFEAALQFFTQYYTPVSLQAVLDDSDGKRLPERAVLVTFDDAYASVAEVAAPLCRKYGVPALFFVNAAFLNNQRLAPDNLVCYVANVHGMETINTATHTLRRAGFRRLHSLPEVFSSFFPSIKLPEREVFLEALRRLSGINERHLAEESALYMTNDQICALASFDFEVGNHTYTHVHGRSLSPGEFGQEIDRNKAELESITGTKVRAFSQPYGSSRDLTPELAGYLKHTGHKAVFFSESTANSRGAELYHLDRVNARVDRDDALFLDLEVLPRLRAVRNRLFGRVDVRTVHQNKHRDPLTAKAKTRDVEGH